MTPAITALWRDPSLRLMVVAMLLQGSFVASVSTFQSLIAVTLYGLSDGAYALVLVASLIVSVAASIGVGIITDQRPSRRALALCAAVTMTAGAVLVLAGDNAVAFVVAHVLLLPVAGTLFGQLFAVVRLVTADYPRAQRDGIMATVRAIYAVPFVVMLALWGLLFDRGVSLLSVYGWTTLTGAVLMVLILRRWPHDARTPWTDVPSGLGFRASLAEMMHGPVLLRVVLVGAVHSGSALLGVVLALLLHAASGAGAGADADASAGAGAAGMFIAIFVVFEIAATLSVGWLRQFARRLHIIAVGTFVYALALAALPLAVGTPALWLLTLPLGVGGAMVYALAIGYLQDLLGSRAGAGASLLALQQIAAQGISAAAFALGAALGGYGIAAVLGAVVMSAAMVAILWLDRNAPLDA
ncbi:hypothetical protein SAMN04488003_10446 [Loktanella fryxellensis]|uniref:Major Facilitator Superfamily protein n=1 Tax=Loktanella fryxellensis TaxID=245187 RepID=A0A1H8AU69_9RHOB|nr:hypothetical protein [Loktanella fryxellensis]SEM74351.1 hypothetical protein SAMN04488003_10446 [Loktanella fryxellensis]